MLFVFQKGNINRVPFRTSIQNDAMGLCGIIFSASSKCASMQSVVSGHTDLFKKAYCAHQNRSIERGSVGPEICTWLTGALHDIFGQIYPNLSVLPHHFHIPCLHFCFLMSMVRLYSNEWTGNLSVLLFVALLLSELNGEAWTYQGCPGGPVPPGKFEI